MEGAVQGIQNGDYPVSSLPPLAPPHTNGPPPPTLNVGPTHGRAWGLGLDKLSSVYSTPVLPV